MKRLKEGEKRENKDRKEAKKKRNAKQMINQIKRTQEKKKVFLSISGFESAIFV